MADTDSKMNQECKPAVAKPLFGGIKNFRRGKRRNRCAAKAASATSPSPASLDPKQVSKGHLATSPPPPEISVEITAIVPGDDESSGFVRELKRMRVEESAPCAVTEPVATKRSTLQIPHIDPENLPHDSKLYYRGRIDTSTWAQSHVSASSATASRNKLIAEVNREIDSLNIYLKNDCSVPKHNLDERGIMQLLRSYLRNTALAIELDAIVRCKVEDEVVEDRLYSEFCTTVKGMGHYPYPHTLHTLAQMRSCKSYAEVASKSSK
jgi:hypothetical protein